MQETNPSRSPEQPEVSIAEQVPHSGVHLNERPVRTFDNTPPRDAVERGLVNPTPDTAEELATKKKRRGLIIGATATVAGAAVVAGSILGIKAATDAAGHTPPEKNPNETSQTPTPEAKPKTWQEEVAAAIEARPKTGPAIQVGDRDPTEADAAAWLEADLQCLQSGAVEFSSEDNYVAYIAGLPGGAEEMREGVRQTLKTDENWKTCASGLYIDDPAIMESGRSYNLDIVDQLMAGRKIQYVKTSALEFYPVGDHAVRVWQKYLMTVTQKDGKVLSSTETGDGGLLQVQPDGTLRWAGKFQ